MMLNAKAGAKWVCPVCNISMPVSRLFVDKLLVSLTIKILGGEREGKIAALTPTASVAVPEQFHALDDIDSIEFDPEGVWRVVMSIEAAAATEKRKRSAVDSASVPSPKRQMPGQGSATTATASGASNGAATNMSSAGQPDDDVIDLVSDDEAPAAPASAASRAGPSTTAGSTAAADDLDWGLIPAPEEGLDPLDDNLSDLDGGLDFITPEALAEIDRREREYVSQRSSSQRSSSQRSPQPTHPATPSASADLPALGNPRGSPVNGARSQPTAVPESSAAQAMPVPTTTPQTSAAQVGSTTSAASSAANSLPAYRTLSASSTTAIRSNTWTSDEHPRTTTPRVRATFRMPASAQVRHGIGSAPPPQAARSLSPENDWDDLRRVASQPFGRRQPTPPASIDPAEVVFGSSRYTSAASSGAGQSGFAHHRPSVTVRFGGDRSSQSSQAGSIIISRMHQARRRALGDTVT